MIHSKIVSICGPNCNQNIFVPSSKHTLSSGIVRHGKDYLRAYSHELKILPYPFLVSYADMCAFIRVERTTDNQDIESKWM